MRFERDWKAVEDKQGNFIYLPVLYAHLQEGKSMRGRHFLLDSGADISMAPRYAFEPLGKVWEEGKPAVLQGISPKEECLVHARIHEVRLIVFDPTFWIVIPICFAEGNVPFILGRKVFFDLFTITLDQERRKTIFESRRL